MALRTTALALEVVATVVVVALVVLFGATVARENGLVVVALLGVPWSPRWPLSWRRRGTGSRERGR
ncbi:hypothetical protein [uncultured Pseudokineococcus sp.]|uniref:hypothetical protein n=1 Tax=uncultured Pseudokineococcus sp. TaxID=1642928 RepID=UPI002615E326|nr:hypothetical protein [uncultured Pseudokineococcus sp.]